MSNTDTMTLQEASNAVLTIDMRYRSLTHINDKEDLKPTRDQAFASYTLARLALLEARVMTTQDDVEEMKALRAEIERAADLQTLLLATGRVIGFFAKLAARV